MKRFFLARMRKLHPRFSGQSGQNIRRFVLAGIFAAPAFILGASPANAQDINCTFSMSNISFGSIDVSTGKAFDATGTFTYACTGDSREMIRICPSWDIGDTGRLSDSAGHQLLFNLYSDESHATVWSSWFGKAKAPTIDVPIGRSERATGSATVYAQINAGQQGVPPRQLQGNGWWQPRFDWLRYCRHGLLRSSQALAALRKGVLHSERQCHGTDGCSFSRRASRCADCSVEARHVHRRSHSPARPGKTADRVRHGRRFEDTSV